MTYQAKTVEEYIEKLPDDRREAIRNIRAIINDNIPTGFEETIQYNMPSWVVPLSLYPPGYHCEENTPLPFISLASQKNYIALYHGGIYADKTLEEWFRKGYAERVTNKLDMGKSCIRLKRLDQIPYDLLGELCSRITVEQWIAKYEKGRSGG